MEISKAKQKGQYATTVIEGKHYTFYKNDKEETKLMLSSDFWDLIENHNILLKPGYPEDILGEKAISKYK